MKTHTPFLLTTFTALFGLIGCPLRAAETKASVAHAHSVKFAERTSNYSVSRGSSRRDVEQALGLPGRTLSDDVWVYLNFGADNTPDINDGCDLLMITFTEGTVSDIKLVNARAEKIYAAQIRTKSVEKPKVASN